MRLSKKPEVLPLNTGSFSSIQLGDDFFKEIGASQKIDGDGFAETFEAFDEIFPYFSTESEPNVVVWVELCCSHTRG